MYSPGQIGRAPPEIVSRNVRRWRGVSVIMEAETMSSTIFTAPEYDPKRDRKRNVIIIVVICVVVVTAALLWWFRYWPETHTADKFFAALQAKDYKTAYGVWLHDSQWEQHQQQYARYPFKDFYNDWGPGGEWGLIKDYKVDGAVSPPGSSGVIVQVTVNGRAEKARVWVEKKDKSITFCMAAGC